MLQVHGKFRLYVEQTEMVQGDQVKIGTNDVGAAASGERAVDIGEL